MSGAHIKLDADGLIDTSLRPTSYFWPVSPENHAVTRIKGSLETVGMSELPDEVTRPSPSTAERKTSGQVHRVMIGGEYLPNMHGAEFEIARIEINSTTYDVTSLYARPGKSRIHYRVVDEYDGETLANVRTRTSMKPLTLGELAAFFLGAWDLMMVLEANFDSDLEGMLRFFRASSPFYPAFDQLLRQRVMEHYS